MDDELSRRFLVAVVDDDESVRESLPDLLREVGYPAQAFASAEEFLDTGDHARTRCLVLDIAMPGMSGPEPQLELQRRGRAIPVVFITANGDETMRPRLLEPIIFITGHGDIPMTVRAMKAGAVEFLTKPFDDDLLLSAIASALDRSRAALAQQTELQVLRGCYATLSHREREVMALVVSGLLNKQIAGELRSARSR